MVRPVTWGLLLLIFAVPFGAEMALGQADNRKVPAKGGEEVQAEADGKKSRKVKVSDVALTLDLSGFPPGPLKGKTLTSEERVLLKEIGERIPELEKQVGDRLRKITNLRDRIVYMSERILKLLERRDFIEVNVKKGLADQSKITAVDVAKNRVVLLRTLYLDRYFAYLKQTFPKEAATHLWKAYSDRDFRLLVDMNKQWYERRKKLGLVD